MVSDTVLSLSPTKDPKIIELCDVQWGECVRSDGFQNSTGSTLHWGGVEIDDKRAFLHDGQPYYIKGTFEGPIRPITPCYSYKYDDIDNYYTLVPGNSSFDGGVDDIEFEECEQVWVSDGVDMRTNCLILLDSASTSFLSGSLGFSSVLQLAEEVFACSDLLPATPAEASRIVIESDYAIRIFLPAIRIKL